MREELVSVIIPVYNAEQTLHVCLEALRSQTYPNLEFIFINDCSTDGSLALLQHFAESMEDKPSPTIKIVSHAQNQGVASARNTGLDNATGIYVYNVDADDHIEPEAIALMAAAAKKADADIVGFNWFLTFQQNERKMKQPAFRDAWDAVQQMLAGTMRWNLWLFLVRRSLYEEKQIRFQPGMNMGEDLLVMMKLFVHARSVTYLDKHLYHYGQSNTNSLTKTYSDRHIMEVTANINEVDRVLRNSKFATEIGDHLDFLKLNIKLPLLISDKKEQYQRWLAWFPEANAKINKNKALPLRTRLLQELAARRQFWAVKLYYKLVIRLIYGILYK
ncbi:glycosyltransferase [Sphingobacterium alkalisoli]|uniref:Glycosyltransferase n=1 Tax=Sphingobacterium alkalisoli TaxID=1874115 RepID=A0A4U0GMQ2_9SPHI|nr:glycosyltransferase [Sphingobacterium alkalisoli]TJY60135.1 glycosyltransferase [Sphingobacterium alkalisoli]GGH32139.1 glycosyl transferase family A [Sphingobacterium alkalisoli]